MTVINDCYDKQTSVDWRWGVGMDGVAGGGVG